jgi:putative glycerol-1-phosphate prenyltransferase
MNVYPHILSLLQQGRRLLAVLVDPDKPQLYPQLFPYLHQVDLLLVGGSTGNGVEACVQLLRQHTTAPILLFPGNIAQFTPQVDALLFLTLLNSRRSEVLIEPHIQVALDVLQSGVETIPMGYVLVDGHSLSAVQRVTHCAPIQDTDLLVRTAVAGQLLGKQLIYLEAGSGARRPVPAHQIRAVKQQLRIPLIVGGGIGSLQQMTDAFDAGADIVVIGNHFEQFPQQLPLFIEKTHTYL